MRSVITYWLEPGTFCPREQVSKRGLLKNPAIMVFPQDSLMAMMRLSDRDEGQPRIFRGFKDLEPLPQNLPGLPKYTSVDPVQEVCHTLSCKIK
ncbi:MAG: hypothetical protein ACPL68_04645 [Candidatus Hydrothermia bacterium]